MTFLSMISGFIVRFIAPGLAGPEVIVASTASPASKTPSRLLWQREPDQVVRSRHWLGKAKIVAAVSPSRQC